MASEETRRESEKCYEKAENALKCGDKETALRLIKKAIRMNPTERSKSLLASIEADDIGTSNTRQTRNTANNGSYSNPNKMQMNKDEADNCLEQAEKAFYEGNLEKAERLALKAKRMHPTPRADELLKQIQSEDNTENTRRGPENFSEASSSHYNHNSGNLNANANDDAEKCIEVAEAAFKDGDLNKAEKFLIKAQRFCQTARGKDLLRQVLAAKEKFPNGDGNRKPVERVRVERRPKVAVPPQDQPTADNELRRQRPLYTEEQLAAIRRVNAATDDYEILGVPKNSKFAAIKKAFRKLTVLLHPDKNKSPEAKEAFIKVTEAVERLKKKENE